jgi:hypothetical protein
MAVNTTAKIEALEARIQVLESLVQELSVKGVKGDSKGAGKEGVIRNPGGPKSFNEFVQQFRQELAEKGVTMSYREALNKASEPYRRWRMSQQIPVAARKTRRVGNAASAAKRQATNENVSNAAQKTISALEKRTAAVIANLGEQRQNLQRVAKKGVSWSGQNNRQEARNLSELVASLEEQRKKYRPKMESAIETVRASLSAAAPEAQRQQLVETGEQLVAAIQGYSETLEQHNSQLADAAPSSSSSSSSSSSADKEQELFMKLAQQLEEEEEEEAEEVLQLESQTQELVAALPAAAEGEAEAESAAAALPEVPNRRNTRKNKKNGSNNSSAAAPAVEEAPSAAPAAGIAAENNSGQDSEEKYNYEYFEKEIWPILLPYLKKLNKLEEGEDLEIPPEEEMKEYIAFYTKFDDENSGETIDIIQMIEDTADKDKVMAWWDSISKEEEGEQQSGENLEGL